MKFNLFNYVITIKKKKVRTKKTHGKFGLDAPLPPKGYVHRWIRAEVLGNGRWRRKNKSGFTLVKASGFETNFPTITEGKFKGYIGVGGLILARIPERFVA
jgi:hypothetical protein|tara:strand:+ start:301 stop:603 length:303 start_codon:yes stop_codon:yes gene_type:complete